MNQENKDTLLSVIIPVYNTAEYLPECLDSIIGQTYRNLEIIIINDGSTDNSIDVIRNYEQRDSRIKVVDQRNEGQSRARNAGLEIMLGDYVSFVDSDDFLQLETFELTLNNLIQYPDVCFLQFPILHNWGSNKEEVECDLEGYFKSPILSLLFERKVSPSVCNKVFSRNIFDSLRFIEGVLYEDLQVMIDICKKSTSVYLSNKGKYFYRYRSGSTLLALINRKQCEGFIRAFTRLYDEMNRVGTHKKKQAELLLWIFWDQLYRLSQLNNHKDRDFCLSLLTKYNFTWSLLMYFPFLKKDFCRSFFIKLLGFNRFYFFYQSILNKKKSWNNESK